MPFEKVYVATTISWYINTIIVRANYLFAVREPILPLVFSVALVVYIQFNLLLIDVNKLAITADTTILLKTLVSVAELEM